MEKIVLISDLIKAINGLPNCPNGQSSVYDKALLLRMVNELNIKEVEIDMIIENKFMIGDIVKVLVSKHSGEYEPHCSIEKGEKTCICEIRKIGNDIWYICDGYCGFKFGENELISIGLPKKKFKLKNEKEKI